tara:strand:- start:232 stop:537 length:306 start_codon:yes stop_codon:yes gene_type:complete
MNRYESVRTIKDGRTHVRKFESVAYPKFERKEDDIYIITRKLDRLDSIAERYYDDSRYWWIIAVANNLGKGTLTVPAGLQLRIPQNILDIFNDLEEARKNR